MDRNAKITKKKPRTLTDLATSAYVTKSTERIASRSKLPPRSKKGTVTEPILLSPETAMKQVAKQNFVFGTSSQLAREESPTLLRDLHEAMRESNELTDPIEGYLSSPVQAAASMSYRYKVTKALANRNLWSAASRDATGNLLNVEIVDLVESPAIMQNQNSSFASKLQPLAENYLQTWHEIDDSPLRSPISLRASLSDPGSHPVINPQLDNSQILWVDMDNSVNAKTRIPGGAGSRYFEAPKMAPKVTRKAVDKVTLSKNRPAAQKPDYTGFTTAQLNKELAKYRFKPIKSRVTMIAILEKCWEGKQIENHNKETVSTGYKSCSPSRGLNPEKDTGSSSRPRGRPRKVATDPQAPVMTVVSAKPRGRTLKNTTITASPSMSKTKSRVVPSLQKSSSIEYLEMDSDAPLSAVRTPKSKKKLKGPTKEISDSEGLVTPSPPRRQNHHSKKSPSSLRLDTDDDDSILLSQQSIGERLFQQITTAVTSASPLYGSSKSFLVRENSYVRPNYPGRPNGMVEYWSSRQSWLR